MKERFFLFLICRVGFRGNSSGEKKSKQYEGGVREAILDDEARMARMARISSRRESLTLPHRV